MISWMICGLLLAGYPLFWLGYRRYANRHTSRVFEAGHRVLTQQIADMQAQLEAAREQRDAADAQTHRYQLKITGVLAERDQWTSLYYEQSVGHGNAQSLLMDLVNQMGARLQRAGVKFEMPQGIATIRQEFMDKHEGPATRALELMELAKKNMKANQAADPATP